MHLTPGQPTETHLLWLTCASHTRSTNRDSSPIQDQTTNLRPSFSDRPLPTNPRSPFRVNLNHHPGHPSRICLNPQTHDHPSRIDRRHVSGLVLATPSFYIITSSGTYPIPSIKSIPAYIYTSYIIPVCHVIFTA